MGSEFENKVLSYKRYLEANQDGEKIPHIFNKLLEMPITVNILQNTGIGKVVNGFRKREGDIGRKAKIIVSTWKDLVAQEQLRLEAENEVLENDNKNYSGENSPCSEDRELSENDTGSVNSDDDDNEKNHRNNLSKNCSDKENINQSKGHDDSHGKKENSSRHTDQSHSHDRKDKGHRHEGKNHSKNSDSEKNKSDRHKQESKKESKNKEHVDGGHRKDSKSEHRTDSKSEHRKNTDNHSHKHSGSEHRKEHRKESNNEHRKEPNSEHRKDSKSEHKKETNSHSHKHSSSEHRNHSNSDCKKHSDSEKNKHSNIENNGHGKHSNTDSRKSDKKNESESTRSKHSNKDATNKSESRNKHTSSKNGHKSESENKNDNGQYDKKKNNKDQLTEFDVNGNTESDIKHKGEIHTDMQFKLENVDTELNDFDGQNHIGSPMRDQNIFERLVNGKTDDKTFKKSNEEMNADKLHSSHFTHKDDSKIKSEGSSSKSHSSSSKSHSSHKEKGSSSKSHHSIKKEGEKKLKSHSEKKHTEHGIEDTESSKSKHKESSRSSKHESSRDKSRSHKSDEKSKSKHSEDKRSHSSRSEKTSSKTKHSSSKEKRQISNEPTVEFLAFEEPEITKKKDADYEKLKSKFRIKKKGEQSQKLIAPSKDFPVKKRKNEEQESPVASKMAKSDKSSLYEELYDLPAPQTHYRPWRYSQTLEDKKNSADEFSDEGNFWTKNTTRTAVYSGRKQQFVPKMYSLYEICLQSLMNNIDGLDYVGGVPFDIMKPILEKCTAAQLYRLEDCNPVFLEETDYLWKRHCDKEFKNAEPDEFESWREMYWRKSDERQEKLLSLKSSITQSMAQKVPVKTTKLAYVDSAAKPPRDVRRQQIKYGTAGPSSGERMKKFSHLMEPVAISKPTQMKRVAPMMQKTLTMMKKIRR